MEKETGGSKHPKYIFLIRHGERGDIRFRKSKHLFCEVSFDTAITDLGKLQGETTGEYLQLIGNISNLSEIEIFSSPFLRTIQTAAHILKGIINATKAEEDKKLQPIIEIVNGLSEELSTHLFKINPLSELLIRSQDKSKIEKNYLEGINYEDANAEEYPEYPERRKDTKSRYFGCFEQIISRLGESEKRVFICITHGIALMDFCEYLGRTCDTTNYCAVVGATNQTGKWKIFLTGDNSHLKKIKFS